MSPVARRLSLYLAVLSLVGCAPGISTLRPGAGSQAVNASSPLLTPRPEGSPDVLVLAVSGRCPTGCQSPADNVDYLTPRGTVQAVAATLEAQGLKVQSYAVSSNITRHRVQKVFQTQIGTGKTVPLDQDGFIQLEEKLIAAHRDWIAGRSNPTRIVLLAHSHGVVWTHALARAHPEVPIATMIDLDGVCDFWEMDNRRSIQAYVKSVGQSPWSFNLADSCGSVRVGHVRYDLKDVVYPNVATNLEVQSQRLLSRPDGTFLANLPFDGLKNIRSDGGQGGLSMFRSVGETHSWVSAAGSRAVNWVKAQLAPLSGQWKIRTGTNPAVSPGDRPAP
jgi:hypothetical protein